MIRLVADNITIEKGSQWLSTIADVVGGHVEVLVFEALQCFAKFGERVAHCVYELLPWSRTDVTAVDRGDSCGMVVRAADNDGPVGNVAAKLTREEVRELGQVAKDLTRCPLIVARRGAVAVASDCSGRQQLRIETGIDCKQLVYGPVFQRRGL